MPTEAQRTWLLWSVRACVCASIILMGVWLIVWHWFGSWEAARALLRGEQIALIPATVDLGECQPGDMKEIELRVVNVSSAQLRLTGVYTSCRCIMTTSLPADLEPYGASTLRITIQAAGDEGDFKRQAVLYTDSKVSPQLPIRIVGRIQETDGSTELVPIPQPIDPPPTYDG